MFSIFRCLLIVALFAATSTMLKPGPALADDDDDGYWKGYWNWYDGSYRPHYYRQHRDYGYRNDNYYRRPYDSPYTYGYSPYSYGYYGDFDRDRDRYRYDRDYYRDRDRRNVVDINGLRFEWR